MRKEITVDAVRENLHPVQEALAPVLLTCAFSPLVRMDIEIAVEEIFLNIASYAYGQETGRVVITAETDEKGIAITFADWGVPFDPLAKQDPDVTAAWKDRKIGGLGIFMVRQKMDSVEYERRGDQNVLRIFKAAE